MALSYTHMCLDGEIQTSYLLYTVTHHHMVSTHTRLLSGNHSACGI